MIDLAQNQTVRHGLSLWSSYQTEMIVKQKIAFQTQELGRHCSLTVTHQPGRRDFRLYSVQRDIGNAKVCLSFYWG